MIDRKPLLSDLELKELWDKNEAAVAAAKAGRVPAGFTSVEQAREVTSREQDALRRQWADQLRLKEQGVLTDRSRVDAFEKMVREYLAEPWQLDVVFRQAGERWLDETGEWDRDNYHVATSLTAATTRRVDDDTWYKLCCQLNERLAEKGLLADIAPTVSIDVDSDDPDAEGPEVHSCTWSLDVDVWDGPPKPAKSRESQSRP